MNAAEWSAEAARRMSSPLLTLTANQFTAITDFIATIEGKLKDEGPREGDFAAVATSFRKEFAKLEKPLFKKSELTHVQRWVDMTRPTTSPPGHGFP